MIFKKIINLFADNYKGEVNENGIPDGYGISFRYTNNRNKNYEGNWKDGKKHGHGIIFDECGNKRFEGEFKNDKKHGNGIVFDENENILYEGYWENGELISRGKNNSLYQANKCTKTITFSDGAKYVGLVNENDEPHGHGVCTYSDGSQYEGEWKNGKKEGNGIYINKSGESFNQFYQNGELHSEVDTHILEELDNLLNNGGNKSENRDN